MHFVFQSGKLKIRAGVFIVGPGNPALTIDGKGVVLRGSQNNEAAKRNTIEWKGRGVALTQRINCETTRRLRITSTLRNTSEQPIILNEVGLFESRRLDLGPQRADVRIFEQSAYFGRVRTPRQMFTGSDQLTSLDNLRGAFASETQSVSYNTRRIADRIRNRRPLVTPHRRTDVCRSGSRDDGDGKRRCRSGLRLG